MHGHETHMTVDKSWTDEIFSGIDLLRFLSGTKKLGGQVVGSGGSYSDNLATSQM